MSTLRYRVITPSGIHIGEEFYDLNAILSLTAIGAKYLLLNKQIALASEQAPVGEPGEPSEDDVTIDVTFGTQTIAVSLTKFRSLFPSIKGDKGDQGIQGPVGSRGLKGDKGEKGNDGRGIALAGVVATSADLPTSSDSGDLYVAQDTAHGWAFIAGIWVDIGEFKGPKGDQGPIGPQGIRGQVGEKGDKGDPGDPGNPAYADRAELGAINAAASETAAAGSASASAASADASAVSASASLSYRNASQLAASGAATSESNAAAHASAAATSEANAATSATNATASASSAASHSASANASATNAGNSATAAATSQSNAATSASNAATSASGAAASQASAASSASSAATSETNAATSATNAQNTLNSFKGIYYGALASDPALDPNGAAVTDGDFYFNTATKKMRFYNGTAWADMVSGGTQKRFIYTATSGQTTFTGADAFGNSLAYTPGCIEVVVNGLWVPYSEYTASNGTSIVLNSGSTTEDVVYVFALAAFTIADVCARSLNGSDILDKAAFRSNLGFGTTTGKIGERLAVQGSTGSLSTGTAQVAVQITLPVGTWDIHGHCVWGGPGATQTNDWISAFATAPNVVSGGSMLGVQMHTRLPNAGDISINHTHLPSRVTSDGTTVIYLNAQASVNSGSGYAATGTLICVRVFA